MTDLIDGAHTFGMEELGTNKATPTSAGNAQPGSREPVLEAPVSDDTHTPNPARKRSVLIQVSELVTADASSNVPVEISGVRPLLGLSLVRVGVIVGPVRCSFSAAAKVGPCSAALHSQPLMYSGVCGRITSPLPVVDTNPGWRHQHDVGRPMPPHACVVLDAHRQPRTSRLVAPINTAVRHLVPRELCRRISQRTAPVQPVVVRLTQTLPNVLHGSVAPINTAVHPSRLTVCNDCNTDGRL